MRYRLQTITATTFMKLLLMIFNIIFWVTGIAILCFGLWVKISLHNLLELSDDFNNAVPYIAIGTGTFIVLLGFLACRCTIKGQPTLLYLLALMLAHVFILELAAGISGYTYRHKFQEGFKTGLNNSIAQYGGGGIRDKDIDTLQSYLKCCGVHSYLDWNEKWKNDSVPHSCCRDKDKCHIAPVTDLSEIYTSGCYINVVEFMSHNLGVIGGAALGLACFQLLGVVLSYYLGEHIEKVKYGLMG